MARPTIHHWASRRFHSTARQLHVLSLFDEASCCNVSQLLLTLILIHTASRFANLPERPRNKQRWNRFFLFVSLIPAHTSCLGPWVPSKTRLTEYLQTPVDIVSKRSRLTRTLLIPSIRRLFQRRPYLPLAVCRCYRAPRGAFAAPFIY